MFVKYFFVRPNVCLIYEASLKTTLFKVETAVAAFWATFLNIWATFLNIWATFYSIWSHSQSGRKLGEKRCLDREN